MKMKKFFIIIGVILSVLLLVYLVWPYEPVSIYDFKKLPESVNSKLPGDTVQVKNLTAFFSNNYRDFVIPFYKKDYQNMVRLPFSPLRLIHPPEYAFTYIKDQTQSTYLEELTYPLRGSLFINGLEPFDEKTKEARFAGATRFDQDGGSYETKVILRYYPSSVIFRIITWIGLNLSVIILWKVGKKVIKDA